MTPMERDSRKAVEEEGFEWGPDTIEAEIRERIRGIIEMVVEEELESTLGAGRSQRVGVARAGYRHGTRERELTTSLGKTTIRLPRARLKNTDGGESEWHSRVIRRYQRRTERVDGALLGSYLSGINSRRLRGALAPLLRGAPISKDAVSRLVGRLRDEFTAWSLRDLAAEEVCYLFLDGWYPKVRIGKKRVRVPVLVVLGVCADGRRVVLDMRIAGQESEPAWRELLESLAAHHVGTPELAVIDGNPGLRAALRAQWPEIAIQRCTNHSVPGRAHSEEVRSPPTGKTFEPVSLRQVVAA
jgi:putative transposase